jgi:hypothetical protein
MSATTLLPDSDPEAVYTIALSTQEKCIKAEENLPIFSPFTILAFIHRAEGIG